MAVMYEMNPPKTEPGGEGPLEGFLRRADAAAGACDGLHVTESVMGTRRISPIRAGGAVKARHPGLEVTATMRVINRDMREAEAYAARAAEAGLDGILVLKGDPLPGGPPDSGLAPSAAVARLREGGREDRLGLLLSVPSVPDFAKIARKVAARPDGFVTQVVRSAGAVERLCARLRPKFRIIPIVLVPSEKNRRSAELLGMDWSGYAGDAAGFAREVHRIAGDVLLTSPNDFAAGAALLRELRAGAG